MNKKKKEFKVSLQQLFVMASELIMENMPLTNKMFTPKDQDECIELLEHLIKVNFLSVAFLESVASANLTNRHCLIDCDDDWKWNVLHGVSRAGKSREEFLEDIYETHKYINVRSTKVMNKYGKNFF